jgi:hypothetical protein
VVNDHSCGAGSSVFRKLSATLRTLLTPGPVAGQRFITDDDAYTLTDYVLDILQRPAPA